MCRYKYLLLHCLFLLIVCPYIYCVARSSTGEGSTPPRPSSSSPLINLGPCPCLTHVTRSTNYLSFWTSYDNCNANRFGIGLVPLGSHPPPEDHFQSNCVHSKFTEPSEEINFGYPWGMRLEYTSGVPRIPTGALSRQIRALVVVEQEVRVVVVSCLQTAVSWLVLSTHSG